MDVLFIFTKKQTMEIWDSNMFLDKVGTTVNVYDISKWPASLVID